MTAMFAPGDLVYARGREWVALPSPDDDTLCLRPLSGAEADLQLIHPALEREPVRPARFALPTAGETATQDGARLLSEALRLSLRRGAGRSDQRPGSLLNPVPTSLCRFSWHCAFPSCVC